MELIVVDDAATAAERAADVIEAVVRARPGAVLALPTGETPTGVYASLARRGVALDRAHVFNLDEYVGLGPEHPLSCGAYMRTHVYGPLRVDPARAHLPDVRAADLDGACARYERAIAEAGGLDLAFVGLGRNGHLGMNEPGTPFDSRTAVRPLAPGTLTDNARLYPPGATLPDRGLTMGLGTIMDARHVLLVAFGPRKAAAVQATLEGPVDPACPASILQRHPHATVVVSGDTLPPHRSGK